LTPSKDRNSKGKGEKRFCGRSCGKERRIAQPHATEEREKMNPRGATLGNVQQKVAKGGVKVKSADSLLG